MKTGVIISILLIIGGQFSKYRYDISKNKNSKTFFFKSQFLWSALYEIAIIFLGAILAIQLTEFSQKKNEQEHTISVLQQAQAFVTTETALGIILYDAENFTDEIYTENLRQNISIYTTNICNTVENIISQSEIQNNISTISYIRFMGILSRARIYANEFLSTDTPSYIYQQIEIELDDLASCLATEIEFQSGKRSAKDLGSWVGRSMSFSSEPIEQTKDHLPLK